MSPYAWTKKELALLRELIPQQIPTVEIAKRVNRSVKAVYRMSRLQKLRRPRPKGHGPISNAVIVAAARPGGCISTDLPQYLPRNVSSRANALVKDGRLVRFGAQKQTRFFTSEAARDAWAVRMVSAPKTTSRSRPGWARDDPMHITPETKYTIAPPPPARVLRTNTYSPL